MTTTSQSCAINRTTVLLIAAFIEDFTYIYSIYILYVTYIVSCTKYNMRMTCDISFFLPESNDNYYINLAPGTIKTLLIYIMMPIFYIL